MTEEKLYCQRFGIGQLRSSLLMYTTLLHADYHTPMDDAEHIDYKKLKKMAERIYRTGWKVATAKKTTCTGTKL